MTKQDNKKFNKKKLKIMFFIGSLSGGGAEWQCLLQANELVKAGANVSIITMFSNHDYLNRIQSLEIKLEVQSIEKKTTKRNKITKILFIIKCIFSLRKIIKKELKDYNKISICSWLEVSHFIAFFASRNIKNIKLIWNMRNSGTNKAQSKFQNMIIKINSYLSKKINGYIFVANVVKDAYLMREKYTIHKHKVIYNKFTTNIGNLDKEKDQIKINFGFNKNDILITNIGTINPRKNQIAIIETIPIFLNKIDKHQSTRYHFLFVGKASSDQKSQIYNEQLLHLIKKLNIKNNVSLIGFQDNINAIYTISDIILMTSKSEGFPNTIIEAIIHKKNLLTTNISDITEILDGNSILKSCSSEYLANKLKHKLDHKTQKEVNDNYEILLKLINPTKQIEKLKEFLINEVWQ